MTLNCLARQVFERTDSNSGMRCHKQDKNHHRLCCMMIDRSWSGNLTPPRRYKQMRSTEKVMMWAKKVEEDQYRWLHGTGGVIGINARADEPRLVRSCGMRRDWSLEDLRQIRDTKRKGGRSGY
ncbi:hypothetical protein L1049_021728 [Liquidambar formosana]|uniref:Uncharacterized protein n=1 Tax=Liquidambar formosana TaxID=63359 RepID=A0AAP0WPY5_LIQFO